MAELPRQWRFAPSDGGRMCHSNPSCAINTRPDLIPSTGVSICLAMISLVLAVLRQGAGLYNSLDEPQIKNFNSLKKNEKPNGIEKYNFIS